ncbi:MAG: hypothetical protein GEU81_13765 [Nitriliruptorales bacterium]|nr:hypothetical protein [Nitriliruptorales bacterium]
MMKLREPRPRLSHRLASLWPGNSFAVSWWPRPHVRLLRPDDPTIALPPRAAWTGVPFTQLAVAAYSNVPGDWIKDVIAPAFGMRTIIHAGGSPLGQVYWGTHRVVEAVAYPTQVSALHERIVEGRKPSACHWCGATVVSERCPFCELGRVPAMPAQTEERS